MRLNDYEKGILEKIADGNPVKEVARDLKVGDTVVQSVILRLRKRHKCENTVQLIAKAFREKQIA